MTESMSTGGTSAMGHAGEDFVCRNCACEIVVKHWGAPKSHADQGAFVCHCGHQMEPEHTRHSGQVEMGQSRAEGGGNFDQEDFLGHGGGAGEATGMGRASWTDSSPGGGR